MKTFKTNLHFYELNRVSFTQIFKQLKNAEERYFQRIYKWIYKLKAQMR